MSATAPPAEPSPPERPDADRLPVATVGVVKETHPRERRVAVTPAVVPSLVKAGLEVLIQAGAGAEAGFQDEAYRQRGATMVDRAKAFAADVLLRVRATGAAAGTLADLDAPRQGQILIGMLDPLFNPGASLQLAERKVVAFALELLPRITRAQPMDVLSSQATVAGYKAVLLAAGALPKMFPLMTTAAGTIAPARVLVVGTGVAGLQSFSAERSPVVTTALVPGRRAPLLLEAGMVAGMAPGSVVVDLAAERGGNCELSRPDEPVVADGVTVLAPTDLPATVPHHASQMYAKNIVTFLLHLLEGAGLRLELEDEIVAGTLVCRGGEVVHPRVLEALRERSGTPAAEGGA